MEPMTFLVPRRFISVVLLHLLLKEDLYERLYQVLFLLMDLTSEILFVVFENENLEL